MAVDGKYPYFSQIQHFVPKLDVRTKTTQFIFKFGQFAKLNKKKRSVGNIEFRCSYIIKFKTSYVFFVSDENVHVHVF